MCKSRDTLNIALNYVRTESLASKRSLFLFTSLTVPSVNLITLSRDLSVGHWDKAMVFDFWLT